MTQLGIIEEDKMTQYISRKLMDFERENRMYYHKVDYDHALRTYADMLIFGRTESGQGSTSLPLPMLVNIVDEQGRAMPYARNMPFRFIKGHGQMVSGDYSYLHQRKLMKEQGEVMGLDLMRELSHKGNMFF